MKLSFPNVSRSYDARRKWIRFWAYDNALEVPFFLAADALTKLVPGASDDEVSLLTVFDQHRDRIFRAAERVYSRNSKGSYFLKATDMA
ncbi:DUF1488 family protein [Dongia rigui]|uniref:DUF1488 domain-containing protein n=1 Tax=Dongia rigui TaxID=940149 RepID=A0ABU5E305_9PROT|nr:DUF1488 domain-containing protein [Dongia rigui]MDY0873697.1 DUF1488 domain-containing protein [Dongia rigui]